MSGFLLDTNIPSELVRTQPEPQVTAWVTAQDLDSLFLSVVSFGELRKGITIMPPGKLFSGRVLPMTQAIAERWGVLEGQRQLMGRPLNVPDAQIAATALEHDLTVVTRNMKDFEDLGVTILNPWKTA
jgi:toxin FitB